MAEPSQIATILGLTGLFVVSTVLAVLAYVSVRRMDQVVLRARMYMNRGRLFNGLFSSALAMVVLTVVIVVASIYQLLGMTSPSAALTIGFAASFVLLAWGFYQFYAMSRPPRGTSPEAET